MEFSPFPKFSQTMPQSDQRYKTTRRSFITQALSGWLFVTFLPAIYAIVQYVIPPTLREQVIQLLNAGKFSDIPAGEAKIVKFNNKTIVLVKTEQNQIR